MGMWNALEEVGKGFLKMIWNYILKKYYKERIYI